MKFCLDCMEYSCGAQGSYNISQVCGDTESDEEAEYETELMNRAYDNFITIRPESEESMTREEMKKELIFTDMVLGAIKNVKTPILMYDEEKDVVRKALTEYKYKLESAMRGN